MEGMMSMTGKLVINAALCDAIMFSAYRLISKCSREVAIATYYASESFSSKRNLIKRVIESTSNKDDDKILGKIIKATEKANNQRNELSHAVLQVYGDELMVLNPRRIINPKTKLTGPYLDSLLKNSSLAHIEAIKSYQELCQKHGVPPTINLE